jgi:AraC family transcriptional regulator of adaptative response / DNA-3-methyladenine glycosylase II
MNSESDYQQARLSRDARFDGQFFVAVKTTKIFCRPICPAPSPKESNVVYFRTAPQALDEGFRPCLRCRPDSAPSSCAWKGVDTTVERALKLLSESSFLPLNEICDKLGISDRYLRELFKQKVGISPKQFQLYEQMLFAKYLLHESQLSVEQVAQASGFQSARRLQDIMQKHMRLSPKQIRLQKASQQPNLVITIPFRPPYNWAHFRDFLTLRAVSGMEEVGETFYKRTITLGDTSGYFIAEYCHEKHHFKVTLCLNNQADLRAVLFHIRRVLDINADINVIEDTLQLAGIDLNERTAGIRLPGVWSPFEAGCRAILGQQISVVAAIKLLSLLVNELGERDGMTSTQDDSKSIYFPTPSAIAESSLEFLGMPQKRRETLRAFARYCELHSDDEDKDIEQWLSIKGIGPWTVNYAKMRGLSNPDIWLGTDLVIKKRVKKYQVHPELASPWGSYLTFQLWYKDDE